MKDSLIRATEHTRDGEEAIQRFLQDKGWGADGDTWRLLNLLWSSLSETRRLMQMYLYAEQADEAAWEASAEQSERDYALVHKVAWELLEQITNGEVEEHIPGWARASLGVVRQPRRESQESASEVE
jgi:hypothetical protein